MTDTGGKTFRKCFIENGGTALAQFANFGDEDEARYAAFSSMILSSLFIFILFISSC